jgi:hypothetical protein
MQKMNKIPNDETGPYKPNVVYMHRLIVDAQPGDLVIHLNKDKLDNRRSNLKLIKLADRTDLIKHK